MKEIFGTKLRRTGNGESMKDKCSTDFKLFCEYYLGNAFSSPWSKKFHFWLIDKYEDIVFNHADEETKTLICSPRSHAKSTCTSIAFNLWCALYGYKKFIVIISATAKVASQFIINLRTIIETNDRIKDDFGEQKGNSIWNSTEILLQNGAYIVSKGAGAQIRGLNFNGSRVDLTILDDMESMDEVNSDSQVQDLEHWLNADCIPMGAPGKNDVIFIGTILSYNSVLWHLLTEAKYSSWSRKRFQAVIEFSTSPLWNEWESIMTDLSRGDRAYTDARDFYDEHRKEMLDGTEVLWPEQRRDQYLWLMEQRLASMESFQSEFMNDPMTEEMAVFKQAWLDANIYEEAPDIKEVNIAIDPAVSTKRSADYSVVVVVARCADNYFYVLECDAAKRSGEQLVDDAKAIIAEYYKYKPRIFCETNQLQAFLSSTLERDLINSGIYLDWNEVFHVGTKDRKSARIESLAPHVKNGHIKFKADQRILLSQMKRYPKTKDDAIDALEMALKPMFDSSVSQFSFGSASIGSTNIKPKSPFAKAMESIKQNFAVRR